MKSCFAAKARSIQLVLVGVVLMLSVSLATAAIVICLPQSPVQAGDGRELQDALYLSEYMQLHRARNAAIPDYLDIEIQARSK